MNDIKAMSPTKKVNLSSNINIAKQQKSNTMRLWLIVSMVMLGIVVTSCLGLWVYRTILVAQKDDISEELGQLEAQRNPELEAEFMGLKKRIETLRVILDNKVYSSQLLGMFEELVVDRVQFNGLNADLSKFEITLTAEAIDYNTLAKQLYVFENDYRVKSATIGGVNLNSSGQVQANIQLELDPSFLSSK